MPITHHREKLLNAIIYFATNTKHCGKTKLYKLLYYLDFTHFKEAGRSVTELEYYAWTRGPAPWQLHEELEIQPDDLKKKISLNKTSGSYLIKIEAKDKFNNKHFTKREMRILNELCETFKYARAKDMVRASHMTDQPWYKTVKKLGKSKHISYHLALNEDDALDIDEVKEREIDKQQIMSVFQ